MLAQVFARPFKIAREAAIRMAQAAINTTVLQRAEDSPRQSRLREERQHRAVITIRGKLAALGVSALVAAEVAVRRSSALEPVAATD